MPLPFTMKGSGRLELKVFSFHRFLSIYMFFHFFWSGDLLIKIENLDKRLLAAVLSSTEDADSPDTDATKEKTSPHLRPFHWYNYLQKERPAEFSALNELVQKLQTGNLYY